MGTIVNQPILQRLVARFKLKDGADIQNPMALMPIIMPTTQADDLLKKTKITRQAFDIHLGNVTIYTVPAGKRVTLLHLVKGTTGTANTIVLIQTSGGANETALFVDSANLTHFNIPIPMEENWYLVMTVGAVGDIAVTCELLYQEEDAY